MVSCPTDIASLRTESMDVRAIKVSVIVQKTRVGGTYQTLQATIEDLREPMRISKQAGQTWKSQA